MSPAEPRGANCAPSQQPLADTRAPNEGDGVDTSPSVCDRIAKTTCYMCACRCGIDVHIKDGKVRYINGNKDHPVNRGVICGKGSAGIMQHYSPARLKKPLLRIGPRGSGEFREIEWEEALTIATERLSAVRRSDPKKLAFFTGRDQSQSLTGWWASQFGTPVCCPPKNVQPTSQRPPSTMKPLVVAARATWLEKTVGSGFWMIVQLRPAG